MKDRFLRQARHEYSPRQRGIALAGLAVIFLGVLPWLLVRLGSRLDTAVHLPRFVFGPANLVVGGVLVVVGWLLGIWSNYAQFTLASGTPVPLMATQKLIVSAPYSYCRNPMALGAVIMYLGVAVAAGSLGSTVLVFLGAACLLTYIKRIEEKEMESRFGQEYLEYRRRTPFLLPRIRGRD